MSTILIVDDEPIIRQLFQTLLEKEGHVAVTACDGAQALCALQRQPPSLILLDLNMPNLDGLAFLRTLRRNPNWAELPVVVLSAQTDRQRIVEAGTLGVKDYLLKGAFSLSRLRTRLRQYLESLPKEGDPTPDTSQAAVLVE